MQKKITLVKINEFIKKKHFCNSQRQNHGLVLSILMLIKHAISAANIINAQFICLLFFIASPATKDTEKKRLALILFRTHLLNP